MDLKELIERGETQSLEFKESLKLKNEIGETVSAFSNSDGGAVIVGVSDRGGVSGVDIGKNTLEELASYIKRNTDPRIFPSVKILEVGGKNVIMIEVKEGAEKPVFFKNHAYKNLSFKKKALAKKHYIKPISEDGYDLAAGSRKLKGSKSKGKRPFIHPLGQFVLKIGLGTITRKRHSDPEREIQGAFETCNGHD